MEIRGAPDIYVMAGSGVALHCVISGLLETPPFIFWYHKTERIAGSAVHEEITRSDYESAVKEAFAPAQPFGIKIFKSLRRFVFIVYRYIFLV